MIDLQGLFRSGVIALATGAPVPVGRGDARKSAPAVLRTAFSAGPGRPHAVDRMLAVAEAFGADIYGPGSSWLSRRPIGPGRNRCWPESEAATGPQRRRTLGHETLAARALRRRRPPRGRPLRRRADPRGDDEAGLVNLSVRT